MRRFITGLRHTTHTDRRFCYDPDSIYFLQRCIQSFTVSGLLGFRLTYYYLFQKLLEKVKFSLVKEFVFLELVEPKDSKSLLIEGNSEVLTRNGFLFWKYNHKSISVIKKAINHDG